MRYTVYHFQAEDNILAQPCGRNRRRSVTGRRTGFIDTIRGLIDQQSARPLDELVQGNPAFRHGWLASHILESGQAHGLHKSKAVAGLPLDRARRQAAEPDER